MTFFTTNNPIQKDLKEASEQLQQQISNASNYQLSQVNQSISQVSAGMIKVQKSLEVTKPPETRGNIKSLERELKSFKEHAMKFDSSFVPLVTLPKEEWPSAKYVAK
ncbi:6131_t:CDS:2 [Ambispora gerdemannii]|uniref:6131_t:CDS:1 n=1 Tax=Ambispora gerdemannii TaxID=144530 RepID=A0A9N8VDS0_9GLOM|nr:6131_t:CDS:2 [Ambispora gerdemannii]